MLGAQKLPKVQRYPRTCATALDQYDLMQIKHKTSHGELLDCFKHVLQYFLLNIPIHGSVVQVDDYGQRTIIWTTMQDTLNYKLKMSGHLCKAHWHPEPLKLTLVGNEGRVI